MTDRGSPTVETVVRRPAPIGQLAKVAGVAIAVGTAIGAAGRELAGRRARRRHDDGAGPARDPLAEAGKVEDSDTGTGSVADRAGNEKRASGAAKRMKQLLAKVDAFQQSRTWAAFPVAVVKKFGDDRAGDLAALIAHYGFLSLFPLLLALVTGLGFLLEGRPEVQESVMRSTLGQFPVIGDQLQRNVNSLQGSGVAVTIGILGALYGGMGVMRAAQTALNEVWDVPMIARPRFLNALIRSALLLLLGGAAVLATTLLTGLGSAEGTIGAGLRVGAIGASIVVNIGLFLVMFRLLTARDVAWKDLVPGAITAAVAWQGLQAVGGYYVSHQLDGMTQTYGFFAVVLGLLSWLYLEAQIVLLAAEVNVVRAARLWPRSLTQPRLTRGDRQGNSAYAQVEERRREVDVEVGFDGDGRVLGNGRRSRSRAKAVAARG